MVKGETTMSVSLVTNEKIAETSSKGNQEKWCDSNYWYKLDQFGYESLTETLTSQILDKSNIEKETPFSFVKYSMTIVNVHKYDRVGCISRNFLKENQSIITVNTLLSKYLGKPLKQKLNNLSSDRMRIKYLVDAVKDCTRLYDFGQYLTLLFEIDSLILNDDRHLNNIAVIEENGKFKYCPIFDNGAGLLSNLQILRPDIMPKSLMRLLRASPFDMTFNRELKTVREMFGEVLYIPEFKKDEIIEMLYPLLEYYPNRDRGIITDRVTDCIMTRQKIL